ncbi:MAG: hypothetical protein IT392_00340 [Nitrospirae bacterium]|nr:hypothetical protein [Nitrospirota bacterium]
MSREKLEKKESFLFEGILIISVIITICILSYESYTQNYIPDSSILSFFHRLGYLKYYPVIYQPGKGIWHPIGWIGSGMMVVMMLYSIRKRVGMFRSLGLLRHWLSAHMFLGIMGPVLVTFHTTFKFNGIIATSFWSMIITMIFGILGRYIYIQIPRSLAGAELKVQDIERMVQTIDSRLGEVTKGVNFSNLSRVIDRGLKNPENTGVVKTLFFMLRDDIFISYRLHQLNNVLRKNHHLPWTVRRKIDLLLKNKAALTRRKNYLSTTHKILHYWHIFHVPLAIVMFLIMILHVCVYYLFRTTHVA